MRKRQTQVTTGKRRNLLEAMKEHGGPMTPEELFELAGYAEPADPVEVADPTRAVEAFYSEVSRLTREKLVIEKRSPYDHALVHLEAKK